MTPNSRGEVERGVRTYVDGCLSVPNGNSGGKMIEEVVNGEQFAVYSCPNFSQDINYYYDIRNIQTPYISNIIVAVYLSVIP